MIEYREDRVQFDFSPEFLRGFGSEKPRNYFEVWDAEGRQLARSPSLRFADLTRAAGDKPGSAKFWNLKLPNGRPGRAVGHAFVPEAPDGVKLPNAAPRVQLVVAGDREDLDETLAGLAAAVAGCGALLFVAVWFVVPRVLRRGLAPLERLGAEVARIDSDSLAAGLSVAELPAELRPIGDRLNDLLARLAGAFERERRFSADVAHELRTPLAELRTLAECALKWPDTRDAATDREVLAIAAQMESLVARMLTLARGERGQLEVKLVPLDLAPLVTEAWRTFGDAANARGVEATFAVAPAEVRADAVLLRSIVANLFDNAVAYTPAGTALRVTGETAAGGGYCLRFANLAGELTAEDVARLFERFWRKEAARTGAGEHLGLGLSLSRMFALAMGWRLSAGLAANGWLVITLETDGQ